jgi:hypothetical protein
MDIAVADATVRATREQATADARGDLRELSWRAVEAGRDRSRRIIKTSRIDPRTGELRYNPAGRLLRDWYFHVYLNTVRRHLGQPAATIDAQQVEDTTSLLKRLRPHADSLKCLHVVGAVRNTGVDDASHAVADVVDHLAVVGARRAVLHAPDDRFGDDTLALHITRHWYLHCYEDSIRGATDTRHPLAAGNSVRVMDVAQAIVSGNVQPVIGRSGAPSVTDRHVDQAFCGPLVGRDPGEAARIMFNHQQPIEASAAADRQANKQATINADPQALPDPQTAAAMRTRTH